MPNRVRSAIPILLSCVGLGALPTLVQLAFRSMSTPDVVLSIVAGFIYATCITVPCCLLIPKILCYIGERSPGIRIMAVAASLLFFAVVGCAVASLIQIPLGLFRATDFGSGFWWSLRTCLLITLTFGSLGTALMVLQERLEFTRQELHRREIAEERERKIAAEARFASLESRVHPHFLFNTLNSISALVREDPSEAERLIERLSTFLRFSLDSELAGLMPLREELKIVRDYLEIEKVRFGPRLRYRIEATDSAGDQLVPALSVQTLVENSVKYAVGARREGAEIVISAGISEGTLRVEVSDDGPGFEPSLSRKPGHGLDLLDPRLAALFGHAATLEMSVAAGRTLVAISVAS